MRYVMSNLLEEAWGRHNPLRELWNVITITSQSVYVVSGGLPSLFALLIGYA